MDNLTLTPKEQASLQVLNRLLAVHIRLEQAATLIGVSERHTGRILAAYREKGAFALAHGHPATRMPNKTSEIIAADAVHLAGTTLMDSNPHSLQSL